MSRALLSPLWLVRSAWPGEPAAGDGATADPEIARAASAAPSASAREVSFNLERADLAELTRHIAGLTGKRFIYDNTKLSGIEVSVVSPTQVSVNAAYAAYLAILQQHGMSVVQQGEFWRIVEGELTGALVPLRDESSPPLEGALPVTRLHRVEHISAGAAASALTHFASDSGDISAHEPGRLLIITDTAAHVDRLLRLLEELDVPGAGAQLWVEPIHYASASAIAEQINALFSVGAGGTSLLRVVADETSNRLIIIGSEQGHASAMGLIRRIDVAPAADGRVHVIALEHAVAEDMERTLSQLLADTGRSPGEGRAPVGSFDGPVRVTADKATNALIVNATVHDYAELRRVIDELDERPRQVFIDAVVLELGSDDRTTLGVGYHAAGTAGLLGQASSLIFGGVNASQSTPNASQLQALALGVRGPDVAGSEGLLTGDAAGLSIPAFGVALQALALSSTSEVLATPHVIALDNTTAEISVGDNIPLQVDAVGTDLGSLGALLGSGTNAGDATGAASVLGNLGGTPRQDVGTRISITPHINEKNQVRLEIEEEISEAGAPSGDLGVVSIVQRSARTSVVVDDAQTVVIGGLVRDVEIIEDEKVPVLGDLPLLGALFRRRLSRTQKTNLILILTPHVIASKTDLQRIFERKMQERQEFLDRYFVFAGGWEPETDLSRASGLVEKVRQAQRTDRDRQRLELERRPDDVREHRPSEPIDLPPDVGRRSAEPRPTEPSPVSQRPLLTSSCCIG